MADINAPAPAGLSDSTVDSFMSLPEDQQRSTLGQMSPATKQLLLGALQKRTSAAATTPATAATPTAPAGPPPKSYWVDKFLGPEDPNSFMSKVGERIKQNVYAIPHAISGRATPAEGQAAKESVLGGSSATTPLGKALTATFTYGPRLLYNTVKGYVQEPATLAGDIVTAAPELAEMRLPGAARREPSIPPPPKEPTLGALSPEQQAKYTADLDKANATYRKQATAYDAHQRQQAIAADTQQGIENLHSATQQLYRQHRAMLDAAWDQVRQQVGTETPTPVKGVVDAIRDAEREDLRGSPSQQKQFRDLLGELGLQDYVENEHGQLTAKPDATAPWQTLRTHASSIGRALSQGNLPGNVYQALKRVAAATDSALNATADAQGAGDAYRNVKKVEGQFRKDFEDLGPIATGEGNPAARVVKAPTPAFASTHILGKAGEILSGTLRRWDPTGRLADEVDRLRGLQDESKSLPKTRTAPPAPTLPKVERPEPEPPKGSPAARRAARIAGAVGGATVGSAVGHPWIGMGAGREAAEAAYNAYLARKAARPAIPPPPQ